MRFAIKDEKLRTFPPGGWQYTEAKTRWHVPTPLTDNYGAAIEKIIQHRMANKLPWTFESIAEELEQQNAMRLIREIPRHFKEWVVPLDAEAKEMMGVSRLAVVNRKPRKCGACGKKK